MHFMLLLIPNKTSCDQHKPTFVPITIHLIMLKCTLKSELREKSPGVLKYTEVNFCRGELMWPTSTTLTPMCLTTSCFAPFGYHHKTSNNITHSTLIPTCLFDTTKIVSPNQLTKIFQIQSGLIQSFNYSLSSPVCFLAPNWSEVIYCFHCYQGVNASALMLMPRLHWPPAAPNPGLHPRDCHSPATQAAAALSRW